MLIVIVIIGILTAAIIPRLNSARGRANDVARKADLNQVATALITYQLDNWFFPWWDSSWGTWVTIDKISTQLIQWWMTSIPRDPANNQTFSWIANIPSENSPYYLYSTIYKWGIPHWWFVLMAKMESPWQANYVFCSWATNNIILQSTEYNDIHICNWINPTKSSCNLSGCTYWDLSELRYVYKY